MSRDFSKKQFLDALRRHDFSPPGFMGYCEITEGPAKGLSISRFNGGTRRRSQLSYLIHEKKKWEAREARRRWGAKVPA